MKICMIYMYRLRVTEKNKESDYKFSFYCKFEIRRNGSFFVQHKLCSV